MVFLTPNYIRKAGIQDEDISFLWDDWNVEETIGEPDQSLLKQLRKISQRANAAFSLAMLEWVIYRFEAVFHDPFPYQYLEVAWAMTIDSRYSKVNWDCFVSENWDGPVKGAIISAVDYAISAIHQMEEDEDVSIEVARMSKLAMHVISNPAPFERWQEWALQQLETLYPMDEEDALGEVVPRAAFDPEYNFDISQTEQLVNQFLKQLDPQKNPYLASPDDMLEFGFEGTPYSFDLEKERQDRIEW